ncbi:MAG TPA: thioredoxin domain-containing protein [Geobacter sp.]|nr:thioredoxin domain-containing protein [Geobacter sp.]
MEKSLHDLYPELPGTADLPPPPRDHFEKLRSRRGPEYRPRTRHLRQDGLAKYTNRLFLETSPYLLQHAHNPVNWFAWGSEPFDLARQLGRPVLVSIGYATCHWCHVMEEESFEDEEIAGFLNRNFIAIKVDREERPDIDTVYMSALHAMGIQGGWPLNVFVTADRRPFYGGTYFPPHDHTRGIGFMSLLARLREVYRSDPERVTRAGLQLTEAVRSMLAPARSEASAGKVSLDQAVRTYRDRFDRVNGGLTGAPKFPSSLPLRLLLRRYRETGESSLFSMAHLTLRRMAAGGIYDQVGGGFHRYATDERWLIPHFEKMLYDNALLAVSYLEGYQVTGDGELAAVVGEILQYLQRDMAAPGGGFYSATDADSLSSSGHREEGLFFTWTPEELFESLGRERGEVVAAYYGVDRAGNFEGRSIAHRDSSVEEVARHLKLGEEKVRETLQESRQILYRLRSRRPLPLRDEKILASWNGLAISAFARAGLILNLPGAVDQARSTANFLLEKMTAGGWLAHSHQEGEAKGAAFLDDYAFFIAGLIDLFEVTGEAWWLERSLKLAAVAEGEFADRAAGGYFMTGSRHEELIAREKPAYDGVVPSGNSVMIMNLLRLNALTEEPGYLEQAQRALHAFAPQLSSAPTALCEMLLALDFLQDTAKQVVIVAPRGEREAAQGLLVKLRRVFLPNRTLVVVCEGAELDRASELVPLLRGKKAQGDRAVAYLCENRSCRLPTSDPEEFGRQLEESGARS